MQPFIKPTKATAFLMLLNIAHAGGVGFVVDKQRSLITTNAHAVPHSPVLMEAAINDLQKHGKPKSSKAP